ncbi:tripartite tricarboxylate transporter substrate-binding protein [Ramlibacter henchirensis]|nr:tripartite tricarboxylate transporter substrate-binding protein [Ramlibacter henchirensis]
MADAGFPAVEAASWSALAGPAGAPADIIRQITGKLIGLIKAPEFRNEDGGEEVDRSPEKFQKYIAFEVKKWGKVAHSIGRTID